LEVAFVCFLFRVQLLRSVLSNRHEATGNSKKKNSFKGSTVQKFNDITNMLFLLKYDHIRTAQG
jgi:hypothetical protein